jgi:hypothetical protein
MWPLLLVHIFAATIGLISGYMAMIFRKGSGPHGAAGTVFFVSMVTMSTTAVYIAAFLRPIMINVVAGLLALYLVVTGRRAAKQRADGPGIFDLGALLYILGVGVGGWTYGLAMVNASAKVRHGIPPAIYCIFGTVALLCAVSDVRMLRRGSLAGAQRIGRHLWRMCLALLLASLSLYPGQAKLFPTWLRQTNLLFVPHILLFGSMIFWNVRIRRRKRLQQDKAIVPTLVQTSTERVIAA